MSDVVRAIERRDFSRIPFHRQAMLRVGGADVACDSWDVSLRGALLRTAARVRAAAGQPCALTIHLDAAGSVLQMNGSIAHAADGAIGVEFRSTDLESFAFLRQLVEVNLGSARLLRGELAALVARAPPRPS